MRLVVLNINILSDLTERICQIFESVQMEDLSLLEALGLSEDNMVDVSFIDDIFIKEEEEPDIIAYKVSDDFPFKITDGSEIEVDYDALTKDLEKVNVLNKDMIEDILNEIFECIEDYRFLYMEMNID